MNEMMFKQACCGEPTEKSVVLFCGNYFTRRPNDKGLNYNPPSGGENDTMHACIIL